jgi:hypothetical protein
VALLKEENEKLKMSITHYLGHTRANQLINQHQERTNHPSGLSDAALIANSQGAANKVLDDSDFSFIKALKTAQQNFVVVTWIF